MAQVKKILEEAGWTAAKLAARFHISYPHICNILDGRERPKVLQTEIARLAGQAPETFWGDWHWSASAAWRAEKSRRANAGRRIVRLDGAAVGVIGAGQQKETLSQAEGNA